MFSQLPTRIEDIRQINPFRALVQIGPLERGFGHTLGNALRRVMMSSISGYAVTEAKIEGAVHEYDRIEGVREDVVAILLNLKKVVFKFSNYEGPISATVKKEGPGVVTAGDIQLPHNAEVVNKDWQLCALAEKARFGMELTVQSGVGYEPAAERAAREKKDTTTYGVIQLDALYSPVRRVAFNVDSARAGERTDLDRLVFDIETNGALDFERVVRESSDVLMDLLRKFSITAEESAAQSAGGALVASGGDGGAPNPLLYEEVETGLKDLAKRAQNCLRGVNIRYVGELVQKSEKDLMKLPAFGKTSLTEIKLALEKEGLSLGMSVPNWQPPPR
jgi:DNA-directed RNA polymerase subunit alpha